MSQQKTKFVPKDNADVWDQMAERFGKFDPPIDLNDHIDFTMKDPVNVKGYVSEGIDFYISKFQRDKFLACLRNAKTQTNKQAFEEGRWEGAIHAAKGFAKDAWNSVRGKNSDDNWATNISYAATKGIGFRQIWYAELTPRQLRLQDARTPRYELRHRERALHVEMPEFDTEYASMFGAANPTLDVSALHWAIEDPDPKTGRSKVNVHVDHAGILADLGNGPGITPNMPYHTLLELAYRTGLKGILPDVVLQRVDFILPAAHENYAMNFGLQANIIDRKNVKLSVRAMCSVMEEGGCNWSGTVNFGLRHNVGGSKNGLW